MTDSQKDTKDTKPNDEENSMAGLIGLAIIIGIGYWVYNSVWSGASGDLLLLRT